MIAITCSSCQKKLSVRDALAGKKVKCPGCGHVTLMPMPTVSVSADSDDARTAAALGKPDLPTRTQSQSDVSDQPTSPPLSKPDVTQGVQADAGQADSLTDFLAPPQADDELGRLGKWRILKVLGHGGMGAVFLGEDPTLGRKVAIKVMLPHLAQSRSSQQRFLREAKTAAALEHDNIVPIFHVDEDRGAPYIVMPLLKGQPLDERLKSDVPLALADILRIARETARGLDAAHKIGLIHRDIKPPNIWLESGGVVSADGLVGDHSPLTTHHAPGRVKILDFGLARAASDDSGLTQQGAIIGTPAYMAPEQGRGEVVDARGDLFSLGVVLYRMCTGAQPFKGKDTVSTLLAVAVNDPAPPIALKPGLPRELSELVMKLLEKDPAERIGTAAEVVQALQRIETKLAADQIADGKTEPMHAGDAKHGITGKPKKRPVASPRATTEPAEAPRRRRPVALIAVGLAAVFTLFCILGGGGLYYMNTNFGEVNDRKPHVAWDGKEPVDPVPDKVKGDKWVKANGAAGNRSALAFEGEGRLHVPTLSVDRDSPLTIECYATPKMEGETTATLAAFPFQASIVLRARREQGNWDWQWSVPPYKLSSGVPFAKDRRVHVAGVHAGDVLRLFVDGKQVDQKKTPGLKLAERDTFLLMGGDFFGTIDQVRVSKIARYDQNFTPAQRFEPDKDTLALYHFDEGAGDVLKDSSGNGHHGKIIGARWVKVDGTPIAPGASTPARGLLFDTDGKSRAVVVVESLKFANEPNLTVEAHLTPEKDAYGGVLIVGMPGGIGILVNGKKWSFGKSTIPAECVTSWKVSIQKGRPVHLAGLRNGDQLVLFVDGKRVDQARFSKLPLENGGPAMFGSFFKGVISEIHISKVARYDKDFTPKKRFEPDADTLALYHFDEGAGDVLKDSSGNGHHGKISGAKWVKAEAAAIPAAQQLEAVKAELMHRNKGFDGILKETIVGDAVTELEFLTDNVTDLTPLQALAGLKTLKCGGSRQLLQAKGKLVDLTPLKDLKLEVLHFPYTKVVDLTPLKEMPLTDLNCHHTRVKDLGPLKGMKLLTTLDCGGATTPIDDFSPLRDVPLIELRCNFSAERDADDLRSIKTLKTLNGKDAKEALK